MIIDITNGYVKADDGAIISYYTKKNIIKILLPEEKDKYITIPCHKDKSIKLSGIGAWSEKYVEEAKYAVLAKELYLERIKNGKDCQQEE